MNYLGFEQKNLTETIDELNNLLASYQVYYHNLRNFHWNVMGENFFDLHERFEELYTDARDKIDDIAERVLTLRGKPMSRLSDYLEHSQVKEANVLGDDHEMVLTILENHSALIAQMRIVLEKADIAKDEGTNDLIGSFLENLEKQSWMLDAWSTRKGQKVAG